jgi:hypothetical protein
MIYVYQNKNINFIATYHTGNSEPSLSDLGTQRRSSLLLKKDSNVMLLIEPEPNAVACHGRHVLARNLNRWVQFSSSSR